MGESKTTFSKQAQLSPVGTNANSETLAWYRAPGRGLQKHLLKFVVNHNSKKYAGILWAILTKAQFSLIPLLQVTLNP